MGPPALCRPGNMKPMDPSELLGKSGHTEETILAHISSLSNNVTQKSSASALHSIRTKKASVFTNPLLFRETLKILNTYQFKLAAKRFILFTLFDGVILDQGEHSLDLFDADMDSPILPFKQIREWRFRYKQNLIDKKISFADSKSTQIHRAKAIQPSYAKKQSKKKQQAMPPPVPAAIKHKYGSYKTDKQFELRGRQRSDATNPPPPPAKSKNSNRMTQKYKIGISKKKKRNRNRNSKKNLSNNFGGNYDGQELADSATTELAGPNPLQADQSIVKFDDGDDAE